MNPTDDPSRAATAPTRSHWLPAGVILAAAISAITGIVSYDHGLTVARWTGSTGLVAYLVPLVPDLMIAMSSVTLIEASAARVARPLTAMLALVAGIGWTVAQNVAAGWRNGAGGAVIAAGIPLALVVTFESLLWLLRRRRMPAALPADDHREPDEPLSAEAALRALVDSTSERALAELLDVPRSRVQTWKRQLAGVAGKPEPEPELDVVPA